MVTGNGTIVHLSRLRERCNEVAVSFPMKPFHSQSGEIDRY
jgi:hypothetical protein